MLTLGVLCSGGLGFDTLVKIKNNYEIKFILTDKKSLDIIQFSKEKNIPLFSGNPRNGLAYEFIKNIIFPYISQKFLRLMGLSLGDVPYVDFNLINHRGETILSYDEDLDTFIGSKNGSVWRKIS